MKQHLGVGISVGVLAARSTFNGALAAQEPTPLRLHELTFPR